MRSIRLLAVSLAALALTACAGTAPGWTFAPAPSATPVPSAEPSGSVAPGDSPGASGEPSAEPSASGSPGAISVQLSALNIAFDPIDLTVPADTAFQIVFANNDASILHDVDIHEGDPTGPKTFDSDPFPGVETRTLDVNPLVEGIYAFVCSVHPNMVGTLTAE